MGTIRFNRFAWIYDRFMHAFSLYRHGEIRRHLPETLLDRLLDVGGGTGFVASQIADLFHQRVVIDPAMKMLKRADERDVTTCCGSALELPFQENQFDCVLCTDALHHIKNVPEALSEMTRVLKPGGQLVILEFHIVGSAGKLFWLFEKLWIDNSKFVTPSELGTMLSEHNMEFTTHRLSCIEYLVVAKKPLEVTL